jgi:hypothetical protein
MRAVGRDVRFAAVLRGATRVSRLAGIRAVELPRAAGCASAGSQRGQRRPCQRRCGRSARTPSDNARAAHHMSKVPRNDGLLSRRLVLEGVRLCVRLTWCASGASMRYGPDAMSVYVSGPSGVLLPLASVHSYTYQDLVLVA